MFRQHGKLSFDRRISRGKKLLFNLLEDQMRLSNYMLMYDSNILFIYTLKECVRYCVKIVYIVKNTNYARRYLDW